MMDRFETAVEKGVNSVFSKVFRSGLKPVDISSAVNRAMDDAADEHSDRNVAVVAPNRFQVLVNPSDYQALEDAGVEQIASELEKEATDHALNQQYMLLGPVNIDFVSDPQETTGMLEVIATKKPGDVAPAFAAAASPSHPIIDVGGENGCLQNRLQRLVVLPRLTSQLTTAESHANMWSSGSLQKGLSSRIWAQRTVPLWKDTE